MNFYTLTFKKKILISFTLILASLIILDIGLYIYVNKKLTTDKLFINSKSSRISNFKLSNPINKDIIFIGSSRTAFQISTKIFKDMNIPIRNFGISAILLEDYPSVVKEAIKQTPKKIIISISVNELYRELSIPKHPNFEELLIMYSVDKFKFLNTLFIYVLDFHKLSEYSERIYTTLKSKYLQYEQIENKFSNNDEISKNIVTFPDCKYFSPRKISENMSVKCENGDSVLLGTSLKETNLIKNSVPLTHINYDVILYLDIMIKNIKKSGIDVSIILEPILQNNYIYDIDKINKSFGNSVEIIDYTNLQIETSFWADKEHLNNKGRLKYSSILLADYIQDNTLK